MEDLRGLESQEQGGCLLEVSMQVEEVSGVLFRVLGVWTNGMSTRNEVEEWTRKQKQMPI